jgi:hypothetical protein
MESGTESFANLKKGRGTLILFICNHCPFVLHVIEEVVMISNDYRYKDLVRISSNDVVNYPQDAPELMTEFAFENNFEFPYFMMKHRKWLKRTMLPVP